MPPLALSLQDAHRSCWVGNESRTVVGPISLEVGSGEFVSILGPSASGKSTLLRMIAGLVPITNGRILIGGTTIEETRRAIGLVLQRPALLPWRTTMENVLLPAEMLNLNREESRNRARRLLAWFGLSRFEGCLADTLPAGMANAVSVCRALVHNPSLLLMDEPFLILDALVHEQILDGFQRLWAENKTTAVLCTRNLFEAVLLSDRVIVLSPGPGRILEIVSVDLPRPRRLDKAMTPQITDHCNRIRMILRAQGSVP